MSITQLFTQVIIIFLLMVLGALIRKLGFLHTTSINDVTNITLYFLSPMVILKAFQQPFSAQRMQAFLWTLAAVFLTYLVSIIISKLVFKGVINTNLRRIYTYGSIYSNNGFMGVPLAQALFGSTGVFFAVASMVGFNVMNWTHGVSLFNPEHQESALTKLRSIILNPNIIAIIVGFLMFYFSWHFPSLISSFIGYGSAAFTPMSMIIIGSNLVGVKLANLKISWGEFGTLLLRHIIYPLVTLCLLKLFAISGTALYTTVILGSCPVAGLVVLFTLQSKGDTKPAVTLMSISTLLSLVTIPLVFAIANLW